MASNNFLQIHTHTKDWLCIFHPDFHTFLKKFVYLAIAIKDVCSKTMNAAKKKVHCSTLLKGT